MIWNPFRHRKHETLNDDQKIDFAKTISELLQVQLMMLPDRGTIESEAGGPKPKAIGYVYGYVDAALRSRGWNMRDMEIGPPITFHIIRRLWPVYEAIQARDGQAKARGVMLLPGVGFDVIPTDCLALLRGRGGAPICGRAQ